MVHQYQLGGYNIVLDACSGSIHVVDEVAYDIISMFEHTDADEIIRAISDKADDSAQMDYPTFEAAAAKRCAQVTQSLAKRLNEL